MVHTRWYFYATQTAICLHTLQNKGGISLIGDGPVQRKWKEHFHDRNQFFYSCKHRFMFRFTKTAPFIRIDAAYGSEIMPTRVSTYTATAACLDLQWMIVLYISQNCTYYVLWIQAWPICLFPVIILFSAGIYSILETRLCTMTAF